MLSAIFAFFAFISLWTRTRKTDVPFSTMVNDGCHRQIDFFPEKFHTFSISVTAKSLNVIQLKRFQCKRTANIYGHEQIRRRNYKWFQYYDKPFDYIVPVILAKLKTSVPILMRKLFLWIFIWIRTTDPISQHLINSY